MKGPKRVLVVDADVARAAGPDPKERPWSDAAKACHDVLNAIWRGRGYHVAFNSTLVKEWTKHQGHTARRWFANMLSSGRVVRVTETDEDWLEVLISTLPKHDQPIAEKDQHLVVLAHDHGDKRLLSGDGKAREKFARIADDRVGSVHWVTPSDEAKKWLLDGAPDRAEWRLRFAWNNV